MNVIDEYLASCVLLPPDVCPTSSADDPRFLLIIGECRQPPTAFIPDIAFIPAYDVMARICRVRAPLTVDGRLLVKGQPVTPEAYLRRWRCALATPLPIAEVPATLGLLPVAVLSWKHDVTLEATKPHWIHPPYPCLGRLLDEHRPRLHIDNRDGEPRATLEIDLAEPNGARDAWWCSDFLTSHRRTAAVSARIDLRRQIAIEDMSSADRPATANNPSESESTAGDASVLFQHLTKGVPA